MFYSLPLQSMHDECFNWTRVCDEFSLQFKVTEFGLHNLGRKLRILAKKKAGLRVLDKNIGGGI